MSSHDRLSLGALLRAAADHELTGAQRAELDRLLAEHPEHAERIRHERELRRAVARVATPSERASDALRSSIQAMAAASDLADAARAPVPEVKPLARRRSFWASAPRMLAAAAVVALAVGTAFVAGRFTMPTGIEYATHATNFLTDEHDRCLRDMAHAEAKLSTHDAAEVPGRLREIVGLDVSLARLLETQGIRFVDGGRCALPGAESMHLRLETIDVSGVAHTASLWVQRDTGRLTLAPGRCYRLTGLPEGRPCVFAWRGQGVVYWLVCDRADLSALRTALDAPPMADLTL